MSDALKRLEAAFQNMHVALMNNDVDAVRELTNEQHIALRALQEELRAQPGKKAEIRERLFELLSLAEMNQRLLEQGLRVAHACILALYGVPNRHADGLSFDVSSLVEYSV
ncbi:hypothetical protein GCM10010885_20870 [Alicyclobacillus cellulosilyticus]|uniref:FlgN protein n=1 Tax=Alicyclobacillus cellulosilyticus TaxID=1003997 RepID=A0A917KEM5_9BACL|nr:hypothetical protein [Alicyclobacillus cellulosilyticus]GGJ11417.1 hypothetical protein GCM10010885_20870 [Alicyclobacillus cellulosilyticus]